MTKLPRSSYGSLGALTAFTNSADFRFSNKLKDHRFCLASRFLSEISLNDCSQMLSWCLRFLSSPTSVSLNIIVPRGYSAYKCTVNVAYNSEAQINRYQKRHIEPGGGAKTQLNAGGHGSFSIRPHARPRHTGYSLDKYAKCTTWNKISTGAIWTNPINCLPRAAKSFPYW